MPSCSISSVFSAARGGKKTDSPSNLGSKSAPFSFALITRLPTQSIKVVAPGFRPAKLTEVFTKNVSAPVVKSRSIL